MSKKYAKEADLTCS